jgi:hypothetical protein
MDAEILNVSIRLHSALNRRFLINQEYIYNQLSTSIDKMTAMSLSDHVTFAKNGYILIRGFIQPDLAYAICHSIRYDEFEHQHIDAKKGGSWSICMLDDTLSPFRYDNGDDPFSILMMNKPFVSAICSIVGTGSENLLTTKRWVNFYRIGQYITPHKDTTGDFQVVLCLDAPPLMNGGNVVLENIANIGLNSGDLLLFKASEILHWTQPLTATLNSPEPVRITGICRFYLIGGKEPHSAVAVYE